MPPLVDLPTPNQLLAEADATAHLARLVFHKADQEALTQHAQGLRERAWRLREKRTHLQ